jgi:hypothetical protein
VETLDLRKQWNHLYSPPARKVELLEVPELSFLMIDGRIEPGQAPGTSPGFQEAVAALYSTAYTLKFAAKQRPQNPVDYPVMPLEGLWWVEDGNFDINVKDNFVYRLMMLQPDLVTPELVREAVAQAGKKRPNPALARLRLESFREGLSVQTMHLGPYATEPATVERMHAFAEAQGYRMAGKHHEIYLGDPMRADPEKLKTILRHAVAPA